MAVDRGQHLDAGADPLDDRGPDEHGVERAAVEAGDVEVGLERVDLAAEARCGARRCRWRRSERWSARPSSTSAASRIIPAQVPNAGMPVGQALGQRVEQAGRLEQHRHRRRLAAGHDQRVDVGRAASGVRTSTGVGAERREHVGVRARTAPCRASTPTFTARTWGLGSERRRALPAPLGELGLERVDLEAGHGRAEAAADLGQDVPGRGSGWWPRRWPWPAAPGSSLLKMPEPTNTASAPSCMTSAASAGVAMPPAQNSGTGSSPVSAISCTSGSGACRRLAQSNSSAESAWVILRMSPRIERRWRTASTMLPVPASPFERIMHGALADAPQRLAEVGGAAHERHGERPLVDVVGLVGRGEHLGLVDVVDAERLEDLGLDEVADAGLGHDRDGDGGLDALDHLRIAHAGHAAVAADVGRHPLERHDRDGAGVLGDLGLRRDRRRP